MGLLAPSPAINQSPKTKAEINMTINGRHSVYRNIIELNDNEMNELGKAAHHEHSNAQMLTCVYLS